MTSLALIPTRDAVVLPGAVNELAIGRPMSVAAVRHAAESDGRVLVVLQRNSRVDAPERGDLFDVGTVCRVTDAERTSGESACVGVLAERRVKLGAIERRGDALFVAIEDLAWEPHVPVLTEVMKLALPIVIEHGLRVQLSARTFDAMNARTEVEQLCAASVMLSITPERLQRVLESGELAPIAEALEALRDQSWLGRLRRWLGG